MRILIASGAWKDGPRAHEICNLIKQGIDAIGNAHLKTIICPLADGGTGLTDFIAAQCGGQKIEVLTSGPLPNQKVLSYYLLLSGGRCVIESASSAGLALVPTEKRNPLYTSTRGVGELFLHAYNAGARNFIIGTGDSATNDCGMGFATALGISFLDECGNNLLPSGMALGNIRKIHPPNSLTDIVNSTMIDIACNPSSILCGSSGTTRRYAAQKGATEDDIEILESGLYNFIPILEKYSGKHLSFMPGAGGAGGLAGMIYALFHSRLRYSFDVIREFVNIDKKIRNVDIVIVGEGLLDSSTLSGKLPSSVALLAKRYNLPVLAVVGGIEEGIELLHYSGIDAVEIATKRSVSLDVAMRNVELWLPQAAERLIRKILVGIHLQRKN